MENETVIVPAESNQGSSGYIELSRTKTGRLFKKHILSEGTLIHPVSKAKIPITADTLASLTKNFEANVCDIVQVPLADDKNSHSEDPARNLGEVVGLTVEGKKLYATIDARKSADDFGKTILGASAMMHLNYEDTRSGQKVGPTLLHVCATNRPYVTELDPYEELVAASAEGTDDVVVLTSAVAAEIDPEIENPTVPLEETPMAMTLDEMLASLKTEHDIDVQALLTFAEETVDQEASLSNQLSAALGAAGLVQLSNDGVADNETIVQAVADLAEANIELSRKAEEDAENARVAKVDGLVSEGRILPAQKDAYLTLSRTNPDLFEQLVPGDAVVSLSAEAGVTPEETSHDVDVEAEIARLTGAGSAAAEQGYIRS